MFAEAGRMRLSALSALQEAAEAKAIFISPWSAWEIAMLASKRRLNLAMAPAPFFESLSSRSGTVLAPLTPSILINAHFLPGSPPKDPSDRIIASTAREQGYTLVTRDRALLAYADAGHINAIEC